MVCYKLHHLSRNIICDVGEHQEYWYLYTGIMLIAGISYVFYQRDIASKRLLTSIGMGIITSVALIIIQLIFHLFHQNYHTHL